jgi:organic radical activating enzyme
MLKIGGLQLGYGTEKNNEISLNIYVTGCLNNKGCDRNECHNKELQDFNCGTYWSEYLPKIDIIVKSNLIDCIIFLGGEPLDQDALEFLKLIKIIKSRYSQLKIYSYTGYNYINKKDMILHYKNYYQFDDICLGHYATHIKKAWLSDIEKENRVCI